MIVDLYGIKVNIERKAVKNINFRIHRSTGKVSVSCPAHIGDDLLREVLESKYNWIKEKVENIKATQKPPISYDKGVELPIWGDDYEVVLSEDSPNKRIEISGNFVYFYSQKKLTFEEKQHLVIEYYREVLKTELSKLIPKWEKITGIYAKEWRIKRMKTRWGSCNSREGRLWFNLYLSKYPKICLEYVVLHELLHIKIPNHGKDFKSALDHFMPNWREIESFMKRESHLAN